MKLGATGKFPHGKLSRSDEGELTMAVAYDPTTDIIRVEFGKPVAWLGLKKEGAIAMARALLKHAGATKIEITFGGFEPPRVTRSSGIANIDRAIKGGES